MPSPFEKNTNAHQRCLSWGLHQMVAVHGPDAGSFALAVEKVFGPLLKGRPWMPLQAKLCSVEELRGIPMLRQFSPDLEKQPYDINFLRTNCALCDEGGIIDSIFIAMKRHTLSWHALRHAPVFMEGLEESWAFDALLDVDPFHESCPGGVDDADQPAAGSNRIPPRWAEVRVL